MPHRSDQSLWVRLVAASIFVLVLAGAEALIRLNDALYRHQGELATRQLLGTSATDIERTLSFALASTYVIAQEVIRSDGVFVDFDGYARQVLAQIPDVSNLQLAPNGVITEIHPLAGNEAAIGHDILHDDARRDEALLAVETGELTLAGPFTLLQGGTGVIGRNPVFLERDGKRLFWGFASALILLEHLTERADIAAFERAGHAFELGRVDPESGLDTVFQRSAAALPASAMRVQIQVPNGVWYLAAASLARRSPIGTLLVHLLGFGVALLFAALALRVMREPERLRLEVRAKTRELRDIAFRDALTGLPNRRRFVERLEHLAGRERAAGPAPSLMLLDIDHFKEVNDVLGHEAGDRLLIDAVRRIESCLPASAMLARLGGDEFTVLIEHPVGERVDVERVAAAIVAALGEAFRLEEEEAHVSASIGIVDVDGLAPGASELLKAADLAMYEAKRQGRGRFVRYDGALHRRSAHAARLGAELRHAIANGELELVYQPIRRVADGRIGKAEALLRWNHPQLGTIGPAEFIPIAEQTGQIVAIGEWVFRSATRVARDWRARHDPAFQISINLSPQQLRSERHVQGLIEHCESIGLEGAGVLLELTEGILLQDNRDIRRQIERLRALGVELALDDFGTGYSSLAYLRAFDIDYLKIDRSFVRELGSAGSDLVLCQAMISIARNLGLRIVAEGVETTEQARLLEAEGCDFLQGYLISRPLGARAFAERFLCARERAPPAGSEGAPFGDCA